MNRLNVGVIGLGRLGKKHAATIGGLIPNARLTAVFDPIKSLSKDVSEQFAGTRAFESASELINSRDVDAVIIASVTDTHASIIKEVMNVGKPIFCEKPLTFDIEEAEEICRLEVEIKAFIQVGFMRRFDAGYVHAKREIEEGHIGDLLSIRCISRDPDAPPINFAKSSGGIFLDLAVHDIDLVRWLFEDRIIKIRASASCLKFPQLSEVGDVDHADINIVTEKGFQGSVEASRNAVYGYDVRTEIIGTKGALFIGELPYQYITVLTKGKACSRVIPGFLERFEQAYMAELNEFVCDVIYGNKPSVTAYDGMMAVRIAKEAKRSYEENIDIEIKEENNV